MLTAAKGEILNKPQAAPALEDDEQDAFFTRVLSTWENSTIQPALAPMSSLIQSQHARQMAV